MIIIKNNILQVYFRRFIEYNGYSTYSPIEGVVLLVDGWSGPDEGTTLELDGL